VSYALSTAISGLWREKWVNSLCTFTIAAGLLIISIALVLVYNVHMVMERIPDRFSVLVFLKDGIKDRPGTLINKLESIEGVNGARYISSQDALRELKAAVDDPGLVLGELEGNPLPASVELRLTRAAVTDDRVSDIAGQAGAFDGVDDVHYATSVLRVIQSLQLYAKGAGMGLVIILGVAVLFVSYSTVKILLYRKQDEIDTLKYLGATKGFIRAPFLLEGAFMGTLAGMLALGGLGLIYAAAAYELGGALPVLDNLNIPLALLPALPLLGLTIGVSGAHLAVGKIRF
jgi:cell division transport system permease protein